MSLNPTLTINWQAWVSVSVLCFCLEAYYVEWWQGETYGEVVECFVAGAYACSTLEMAVHFAKWTALLAVPAIVVGWVLQYFIGMILSAAQERYSR